MNRRTLPSCYLAPGGDAPVVRQYVKRLVRDHRRLRQRRVEIGRRQRRAVGGRYFGQLAQAVHRDQAAAREHRARPADRVLRSEEHTSELQSLMRISYAVFCLKKKKIEKTNVNSTTQPQTHQTDYCRHITLKR